LPVPDRIAWDGVLESLITQARLEMAAATSTGNRAEAWNVLKWLVRHRRPDRVAQMERERGLVP
jgi:hypothetical protein